MQPEFERKKRILWRAGFVFLLVVIALLLSNCMPSVPDTVEVVASPGVDLMRFTDYVRDTLVVCYQFNGYPDSLSCVVIP